MIKSQKELLTARQITGHGALYYQDLYLGECEYQLELRRSRLYSAKSKSKPSSAPPIQILITMAGAITIGSELFVKVFSKRNQLTLHLNDDYLMPVCAFPTSASQHVYSVIGRVVTEPVEEADFGLLL